MTEATQPLLPVTPELLPCGNCGAPARWIKNAWRIKCTRPSCGVEGGKFEQKHVAITAWNTRSQSHSLPGDVGKERLSQIIAKARDDWHDGPIGSMPDYIAEQIVAALTPSPCPGDVGMRENDKPPAHWTPDDKCDRHPQTAEEWDWRADKPENAPTDRSIKRLNFAVDRGDPAAPNQMALVLRVDLSRALGRLTHYTAHRELLMEQKAAALTPSALSGDAGEALAWLEQHTECQLSHRHDFCEDDPEWEVYAVNGGRNDREWALVGSGETIVEAIFAARAALPSYKGAE